MKIFHERFVHREEKNQIVTGILKVYLIICRWLTVLKGRINDIAGTLPHLSMTLHLHDPSKFFNICGKAFQIFCLFVTVHFLWR